MRPDMSSRARLLFVGILALAAGFALVGPTFSFNPPGDGAADAPSRTAKNVKYVYPVSDSNVRMWPYTSRARSFDQATLPINIVIYEDPATVRRLLASGGSLYWDQNASKWQTEAHGTENETSLNATDVNWGRSQGAARYTYIETPRGGGWHDAIYQLHKGDYFGTRYHLRFYEGRNETKTWTVVQAHHEHWDWFRLRHQVDSLSSAQHFTERDLMATGLLADIRRERYGNGGAIDADGWVTVAEFAPVVAQGPGPGPTAGRESNTDSAALGVPVLGILLAAAAKRRAEQTATDAGIRITRYHLALFASTAALLPAVRAGSIAVERAFPASSPVLVGGPLYVLLALGLPTLAVLFGRFLPAEEAFTATVLGFGTGTMVDYAYLEIGALPFDAVVHRLVLLLGLGLIAAGGVRWGDDRLTQHRYHLVGLIVWVSALLWPLVGV